MVQAQEVGDLKREKGDGERLTGSVYILDGLPKGQDANQQAWVGKGRHPHTVVIKIRRSFMPADLALL